MSLEIYPSFLPNFSECEMIERWHSRAAYAEGFRRAKRYVVCRAISF